MTKLFKVRDKVTGKFWNGNYRRSAFDDQGKTWKKVDKVENSIGHFINYRNRYNPQTSHSLPDSWEIVTVELVEKEVDKESLNDFMKFLLLKTEVEKSGYQFSYFVEKMRNKKVLDKIEFLILLKPSEGRRYVDMERIIEARSHIRGLGIKTRTFRESSGVFGMMDRQQALRARMTLDVEATIDLRELRNRLGL
jgi:hypothetical protein